MLFEILVATITICLMLNWWRNREKWILYNQNKNTLRCFPFVGHALYFTGSGEDRMKAIHLFGQEAVKCGGSTCVWMATKMYLIMTDPADVDVILKSSFEKDLNTVKAMKTLLGNGSIFAPVPEWRRRRKINLPVFSPKKLHQYMDVHARQAEHLVDRLQDKAGSGDCALWYQAATYTLAAICETTLGVVLDGQENTLEFLDAFSLHTNLLSYRMQPLLHYDILFWFTSRCKPFYKTIHIIQEFITKLVSSKHNEIQEKMKTSKNITDEKENQNKTVLEWLLDMSNDNIRYKYTNHEIYEEILGFILAGTDTTAVTICFTAVLLSYHQDVQKKVYNELLEHFGDVIRPVEADDLPHLPYLEAVVKETMRLYPPVPIIIRHVEEYVQLPSGKKVVPGIGALVNIWTLHRSKENWGADAEVFRPERFLDNGFKNSNFYLPFSRGPRNCIGFQYGMMSAKIALASMVMSFRILPKNGAYSNDGTLQDLRIEYDITIKSLDNFTVQLEARKPANV